jgi:hypothetical protein
MPLPLPNLDDRTYNDLLEEARALIPSLYPAWTDHNPTDPGIILIELFAWLTEMIIYHLNRVPDASYIAFLRLLRGPDWRLEGELDKARLDAAIRETVLTLREPYRAATCDDFEYLATQAWPKTAEAHALQESGYGTVQRARCIPQRNLEITDPMLRQATAPAHISLIVVTDQPATRPGLTPEVSQKLWKFLDTRRLLTTRHHVVGPDYVPVTLVGARLVLHGDVRAQQVQSDAMEAVRKFFHPIQGGPEGKGWPFGRDVYVSEIYELLDKVEGIDYVGNVVLTAPNRPDGSSREQLARADVLIGITIDAHELVEIIVDEKSFAYVPVTLVGARLVLRGDAVAEQVRSDAAQAVRTFFHPTQGGPEGEGWPFDRDVYVSEIYELLDKVEGIDYAENVVLTAPNRPDGSSRALFAQDNVLIGIDIDKHERVEIIVEESSFTIR